MEAIAQIFTFMGYWETLGVAACGMIGVWLLTNKQEWFKREQKFLKNTSLFADPKSIPLIGNVLTFACNYRNAISNVVELTAPESDDE